MVLGKVKKFVLIMFFNLLLCSAEPGKYRSEQMESKSDFSKWSYIFGKVHEKEGNKLADDLLWVFRFGHHWLTMSIVGTASNTMPKWGFKITNEELLEKVK